MEQDKTFNIGNNNEILAAQFGVYANEDVTASDGTVIPANALVTYANCDENGNITFDCDLPLGYTWYVKEIATDNHYILSDEQYYFDTEYAGQDVKTINIEINNGEAIENKIIYSSVKGLKIDRETNEAIEGAVFGLFKNDETNFTKENAILTAQSDKDGIFTFENIPYGDWIIKELNSAKGYLSNDDVYNITIIDNEQVVELTVVNDKIPELKTTASIDGEKEVTAQGEVTITDTVEYKHLIVGEEYVIKGILMDKSTGKAFKVNGETVTSEVTFTPEKSNGTVDVTFTFDASGITKDTELVVFETLYRDGVELATHSDLDDEDQTVTIKVPVTTTPKTGDDRNYGTWIGLGTVALGAAIAGVILKIKSKKDEDDD
jgi:sulfur transfer complex TusBCD TusB component (DsrH family)